MRRIYDAVKVLGLRDDKIAEEFKDRKALPLYGFIEDNAFKPFSISKDIIKSYTKKAEEQGVENPLNDRVLDRLFTISERLYDKN